MNIYRCFTFLEILQNISLTDVFFEFLAFDHLLCADEQNEGTVWFAQTIFDAVIPIPVSLFASLI